MTVVVSESGTIKLQGACTVEDAEVLVQHLLSAPNAVVDWSSCDAVHTALIQVFLVAKLEPTGTPGAAFLRDIVAPMLRRRD